MSTHTAPATTPRVLPQPATGVARSLTTESRWCPQRIVVVIPTYNEVENIGRLLERVLAVDARIDVVVADDDSPDGTALAVLELGMRTPRVRLLRRQAEFGRGHAGRDAFAWALRHDADAVVEMDGDFSHDPRHLPELIAALDEADVVLGSRQVTGGRDVGRPAWRVFLTRASNLWVRLVLGATVRDCNSGYRAFRRSALEAVEADRARSAGPAIVHELLYKAQLRGLRIVEVPIVFREREHGQSTLTFGKLLRSYISVLKLRALALTGHLFAR